MPCWAVAKSKWHQVVNPAAPKLEPLGLAASWTPEPLTVETRRPPPGATPEPLAVAGVSVRPGTEADLLAAARLDHLRLYRSIP
jgi:hypothetical protein